MESFNVITKKKKICRKPGRAPLRPNELFIHWVLKDWKTEVFQEIENYLNEYIKKLDKEDQLYALGRDWSGGESLYIKIYNYLNKEPDYKGLELVPIKLHGNSLYHVQERLQFLFSKLKTLEQVDNLIRSMEILIKNRE
tara:strand:+ start:146 stop:562 length:417 start_codon:yes stop_codon:yes gene_type:complete